MTKGNRMFGISGGILTRCLSEFAVFVPLRTRVAHTVSNILDDGNGESSPYLEQ